MKIILLIIISPLLVIMFIAGVLRYLITGRPATIEYTFDIIEILMK